MADLDVLLSPGTDVGGRSWATVTQAFPLRIRIDGEASALDLTPDSLVGGLVVGERVWVELVPQPDPVSRSRRVIVIGRAGGSRWQTWSPTLTALTVGSGSLTAKYTIIGDTVMFRFRFVYGNDSAVGTDPGFTLPVTPHDDFVDTDVIAWGALRDAAPAQRVAVLRYMGSGNTRIFWYNSTPTTASVTATAPWTWANGDSIHIWGTYYI